MLQTDLWHRVVFSEQRYANDEYVCGSAILAKEHYYSSWATLIHFPCDAFSAW